MKEIHFMTLVISRSKVKATGTLPIFFFFFETTMCPIVTKVGMVKVLD